VIGQTTDEIPAHVIRAIPVDERQRKIRDVPVCHGPPMVQPNRISHALCEGTGDVDLKFIASRGL